MAALKWDAQQRMFILSSVLEEMQAQVSLCVCVCVKYMCTALAQTSVTHI